MQEEDSYIRLAATYLFRTATMEVKHFNEKDCVDKFGFEHNGMDMVNLDPLGVNSKCPIVDRYNSLAYSLFQYIHYDLSKHSGMETLH